MLGDDFDLAGDPHRSIDGAFPALNSSVRFTSGQRRRQPETPSTSSLALQDKKNTEKRDEDKGIQVDRRSLFFVAPWM